MEVVERTAVGSQTTVVQANQSAVAGGSGGTGFIKTGDIVTVQKSVVGGVQITEIFDAPSFLLGIPINYAISDGMTSPQVLPPDDGTLTVSQMKLTPLQDGILTFSYRHI